MVTKKRVLFGGITLLILAVVLPSLFIYWDQQIQIYREQQIQEPARAPAGAVEPAPSPVQAPAGRVEPAPSPVPAPMAPARPKPIPPVPPPAQNEFTEMRMLGQRLEQLPKGKIYLAAPVEMKVGDKRNLDARVGVNVPDDVLKGHTRGGDQRAEGTLRVSHEMVATLNGPGFSITLNTPEKQTVAEGFPTIWQWEIEAKQEGTQELEATLYALIPDSASGTARQRIDSYTDTINVTVNPQTWGEWLRSARDEIDAVKAVMIALASTATVAMGWLGISLRLRRASPAVARKSRSNAITVKAPRGRKARSVSGAGNTPTNLAPVPDMEDRQHAAGSGASR